MIDRSDIGTVLCVRPLCLLEDQGGHGSPPLQLDFCQIAKHPRCGSNNMDELCSLNHFFAAVCKGQMQNGKSRVQNLHHNKHAFALLELMFVLGLLSFVALVAGQIFLGVTRTTSHVSQRQTAQIRVDQATRRLRQDVWNATQITLQDPHHLQIKIADKSITWTAGRSLKREGGLATQNWDELQTDLHFQQHGPTISLAQEPTQGESGGRITLLSANSLLKGNP